MDEFADLLSCMFKSVSICFFRAGNTVVIKPSELSEHTSNAQADAISSNFDPSFLTVVQGGVEETIELLKKTFGI